MTENKIRIMVMGATGFVGTQLIQLLHDRGVEIVAAVGRRSHMGEDVGEVAGIGAIGVNVEPISDLAGIIERARPNVAIDATDPYLKNLYPAMLTCAEHGVNVLSLSIEMYYPWAVDADLADKLDAACKENDCTIVATGIQDANWSGLAAVISANCVDVKRIHGENHCVLDFWGKIGAMDSRAAISLEEFDRLLKEEGIPQNSYTYALYDIARTLGLTVTKETNDIVPRTIDRDFYWEQEDMTIPAGDVIEVQQSCALETAEGVGLDATIYYAFSVDGFDNRNLWEITGEPSINVVTDDARGDVTTAYNTVNRVPDVINAPAGMLAVGQMPLPFHKHGDLNAYVK